MVPRSRWKIINRWRLCWLDALLFVRSFEGTPLRVRYRDENKQSLSLPGPVVQSGGCVREPSTWCVRAHFGLQWSVLRRRQLRSTNTGRYHVSVLSWASQLCRKSCPFNSTATTLLCMSALTHLAVPSRTCMSALSVLRRALTRCNAAWAAALCACAVGAELKHESNPTRSLQKEQK